MEVSTETDKTMATGSVSDTSSQGVSTEGELLRFPSATISADRKSDKEIRTRVARALALMQLTRINRSNNISTSSSPP